MDHNKIMKHFHHIVPRHMGGTDDPSNLIEVTIAEHAELHFDLYLTHGKREDWVASFALSGQAKDPEFIRERAVLGGKREWTDEQREAKRQERLGYQHSEKTKEKTSKSMSGKQKSESHRENIRQSRTGTTARDETKMKMSKSRTGQKWFHDGNGNTTKAFKCPPNYFPGRK